MTSVVLTLPLWKFSVIPSSVLARQLESADTAI
jgi:hypothetical protein